MNEEFESAINQINYRAIFENQKEKLKEILQGQMIYSSNGGQFILNALLFAEINLYLTEGKARNLILDMNLNPVRIEDLQDFYNGARSQYTEAINKYASELAKIKKSRQIATVVQLDLEDDNEE